VDEAAEDVDADEVGDGGAGGGDAGGVAEEAAEEIEGGEGRREEAEDVEVGRDAGVVEVGREERGWGGRGGRRRCGDERDEERVGEGWVV
jgi:hypothetical protein